MAGFFASETLRMASVLSTVALTPQDASMGARTLLAVVLLALLACRQSKSETNETATQESAEALGWTPSGTVTNATLLANPSERAYSTTAEPLRTRYRHNWLRGLKYVAVDVLGSPPGAREVWFECGHACDVGRWGNALDKRGTRSDGALCQRIVGGPLGGKYLLANPDLTGIVRVASEEFAADKWSDFCRVN